jgi:F-type H+-transporting ATPase subunit b
MEILQDSNIWILFSFILFLVFAFKKLKEALFVKIDAHIDSIRTEISIAESLRIEAQDLLAQFEIKQRDAQKEADEIVKRAREHAEEIRKDAKKELDLISKRREEQLSQRLKLMEEAAIQHVRAYATDLAVKATKEIIEDYLDDAANAKLVENSIGEVAAHLKKVA